MREGEIERDIEIESLEEKEEGEWEREFGKDYVCVTECT